MAIGAVLGVTARSIASGETPRDGLGVSPLSRLICVVAGALCGAAVYLFERRRSRRGRAAIKREMEERDELGRMLSQMRRPGDDLRSVESVQWALWATLMCHCERCGAEYDLPHWSEQPWNGDVIAWANEWAPKAHSLGWSMAEDRFNLLCPACRMAA